MAFHFNTNGGFITCASQQVCMRVIFDYLSTNRWFSESNAILALHLIPIKKANHHLMLSGLDLVLAGLAAIAAGAVNVFAGHTNQLPIGSQRPITHV